MKTKHIILIIGAIFIRLLFWIYIEIPFYGILTGWLAYHRIYNYL